MDNYLPVLLVSVAANSIPDDSSVSTLPRGQVDYLSHDWEEEDVWRSWRNMTRQKNEIANGLRLENASWRTWWKQRNGLGTVTPETLNWLKDSDVTWLYGPLHTAVDWTPRPKPVSPTNDTSALDLSTSTTPTHKPILKHRSISQLLTSDLPTSPIFSPTGSDDEDDVQHSLPLHLPDELEGSIQPKRPSLPHTKSDTHITRWGSNRNFRTQSPPTIDTLPNNALGDLNTPLTRYAPTPLDSLVSSSNTSPDNNPTTLTNAGNANANGGQKRKHISFNTFVQQCIAIDKPKIMKGIDDDEDEDEDFVPKGISGRHHYEKTAWVCDDDGYEEDEEEDSPDPEEEVMWDEHAVENVTGSSDSDSVECDEGVQEEDGRRSTLMETRLAHHISPARNSSPRSQSTVSTASSSSSTSTSTTSTASTSESGTSQKPSARRFSSSTADTYRPRFHSDASISSETALAASSQYNQPPRKRMGPPLIRTFINSSSHHRQHSTSPQPQSTHVTIAPIAPTTLKTGPNRYHGGWAEGFGDEGGSDDGLWGGGNASKLWSGSIGGDRREGKGESGPDSGGGTPVELVYAPPFGRNYSVESIREVLGRGREFEHERDVMEDHEDGFGNVDEVYKHRNVVFSVGDDDDEELDAVDGDERTALPVVILPSAADSRLTEDSGEQLSTRRSFRRGSIGYVADSPGDMDRSRSRSRSRTPSPVIPPPPTRRSVSISPPSSSLLSPPLRGRGSISQQDIQVHSRGRSSTRTSSALADRDRSASQQSPMGSLSPDGIGLASAVGAYVSGRIDREREKAAGDRERERSRGRDRTGIKRLGPNASPDDVQDSLLRVSPAPITPPPPSVQADPPSNANRLNIITRQPSSSSSSSSSSCSASSSATVVPSHHSPSEPSDHVLLPPIPFADVLRTEDLQRTVQPTPLNSPIISMRSGPDISTSAITPATHTIKTKSPLAVSAAYPAEPSTSYSISPPHEHSNSPSPTSPRSPSSPVKGTGTVVGKAVGIVSSAGAFLGLWQSPGPG